jgi:hypothetical protein
VLLTWSQRSVPPGALYFSANFSANAYYDSVTDQPLFLSTTTWNLCSTSHVIDDAPICWYEADRTFTAPAQTVLDTLDLPDGAWELRITAPLGGFAARCCSWGRRPSSTRR